MGADVVVSSLPEFAPAGGSGGDRKLLYIWEEDATRAPGSADFLLFLVRCSLVPLFIFLSICPKKRSCVYCAVRSSSVSLRLLTPGVDHIVSHLVGTAGGGPVYIVSLGILTLPAATFIIRWIHPLRADNRRN